MPALLPVVFAAGAGAAATSLYLTAFQIAIVQFGVAAATSMLINRRTSSAPSVTAEGQQVIVRSAVQAQRIIYGETVVSGPLVYSRVSRATKHDEERHRIPPAAPFTVSVAFAADYQSTSAVNIIDGFQFDWGFVEVPTPLTPTAGAPGATEYSVTDGVYTFHSSLAGRDVAIGYSHGGDVAQNSWLHIVLPLASHQVEEIGDVYFNEDIITSAMLDAGGNVVSGKFAGHARIAKYLGAPGQPADPVLISMSNGDWTSQHVGEGIAYIIVTLLRAPNVYLDGVPNIKAKVKGALVYDPRTTLTQWSNNWALVVRDYLTRADGLGCSSAEINDTLLIAAANVSDEDVDLDATPTTQKRYTADGSISLDARPVDALRELLSAGAGMAVYSVSTWDVYAGAYVAPTRTITVSDLREPIAGAPDMQRRDIFNAVRGTFVNQDTDWQLTSFPPVVNATYQSEDGGEQIFRDIELPFTKDSVRAQRLAKIALERGRQGATLAWPGKLTCFRLNTGENVNVEVAPLGYTPKVFRVNGWRWEPGGGVDLALQEESSAAYDWNFGEATVLDPAPNTSLPASGPLPPPGAPEVTEELYVTRDGRGVAARALMSWSETTDAYVTHYEPEYKLAADGEWKRISTTGLTSATVEDIAPGTYDFRVRALDDIGRSSGYSQTRKEVVGLGAEPAAPTGLSLQVAGGTAILSFDQHPELDVLRGGRILVRHTEATTAQSWEESLSIGNPESYPGDAVIVFLPLKPGSYLVKARDSTGQESASFATAVTKQASVLTFAQLATPLQEDSTFPGTHDNTVETSGALLLATPGTPEFESDFTTNWTDDGFSEQAKVPGSRATCVTVDGKECVRLHTEVGDTDVAGSGTAERNDLTTSQAWTDGYAGVEQWWEHSIWFPDDFVQPPESDETIPPGVWHWCAPFGFHQTGDAMQSNFHMIVYPATATSGDRPTGLHLEYAYGDPEAPTIVRVPIQEGAITKNMWYRFVYHIKWASDGTGILQAWVNETQYIDYSGPTLYSGQGVYFKLGNYHSAMGSASSIIHTGVIRDNDPISVSGEASSGAVRPSGVYTFSAGFDFTTVSRARITGQIEAIVFNIDDLIDSRTDPIDSWPSIDGDVGTGSLGDAWLEARETDDNPAGTPTWSAWKRLDSTEVECRGMQFRLQMRSFDPTYNIQVDILRVKAEEVV